MPNYRRFRNFRILGIAHASHDAALVMQTKDYVYLGLIALTAALFYWHGYLAARSRARKSFTAVFHDARSMMELPSTETRSADIEVGHRASGPCASRGFHKSGAKIRAVFGVN